MAWEHNECGHQRLYHYHTDCPVLISMEIRPRLISSVSYDMPLMSEKAARNLFSPPSGQYSTLQLGPTNISLVNLVVWSSYRDTPTEYNPHIYRYGTKLDLYPHSTASKSVDIKGMMFRKEREELEYAPLHSQVLILLE